MVAIRESRKQALNHFYHICFDNTNFLFPRDYTFKCGQAQSSFFLLKSDLTPIEITGPQDPFRDTNSGHIGSVGLLILHQEKREKRCYARTERWHASIYNKSRHQSIPRSSTAFISQFFQWSSIQAKRPPLLIRRFFPALARSHLGIRASDVGSQPCDRRAALVATQKSVSQLSPGCSCSWYAWVTLSRWCLVWFLSPWL